MVDLLVSLFFSLLFLGVLSTACYSLNLPRMKFFGVKSQRAGSPTTPPSVNASTKKNSKSSASTSTPVSQTEECTPLEATEEVPPKPARLSHRSSEHTENNPLFCLHELPVRQQFQRIKREFATLESRTMDPSAYHFETSFVNMEKNRYSNVLANEQTLYPSRQSASPPRYINGNLVDLGVTPVFVACQAPTPAVIPDFLLTLYDQRLPLVLMLTQTEESMMVKADPYWPAPNATEASPTVYGGVAVWPDPASPEKEDGALELVRRAFFIRPVGSVGVAGSADTATLSPAHRVDMVQYVGWPDHGVPNSTAAFEALVNEINAYDEKGNTKPIVVHCSAGIGRTGTLIGAYAAVSLMKDGKLAPNTMYTLVAAMRQARFGMVQRVEQYMFMYQIVMHYMGLDVTEFAAQLPEQALLYTQWMMSLYAKKA